MNTEKINPQTLQLNLRQFMGGGDMFRHPLNKTLIFSEGVKYLAENAGAYWLIDIVASVLNKGKEGILGKDSFMCCKLKKTQGNAFVFTIDNGNDPTSPEDGEYKLYYKQEIPFSDFPLDEFKLFLCNETLILPSEY